MCYSNKKIDFVNGYEAGCLINIILRAPYINFSFYKRGLIKLTKVKNLILGAGLSGISFAYFSKDKDDYLVLEKTSNYGGYCQTFLVEDYVWDYAGHFYHFKTEELRNLFLTLIEEEEKIERDKNTKIYYKDELVDFPFQMNIHQLNKEEFIDCLYDLYVKEEKDSYTDFLDMLYGKFGKSITEKFLKPYNEKLYATSLRRLDTDAMGRFFPYADFGAIIKNMKKPEFNSYNSKFWYLKQGAQYFIDKLYNGLEKNNFKFESEVKGINLNEKFVTTVSGDKIFYENLINTIPLNLALSLTGGYDELVEEMSYNKVLVFNLGFERASNNYKDEHWIYFPGEEVPFYRVGFYNNILGQEKLSLYVEIGLDKKSDPDVDKQFENTIAGLELVGIKDLDNNLVAYNHVIMDPAYVHINSYTQKKIDLLLADLCGKNFYTLGRYGKWTYNSMEDSMLWAKELAKKLGEQNAK